MIMIKGKVFYIKKTVAASKNLENDEGITKTNRVRLEPVKCIKANFREVQDKSIYVHDISGNYKMQHKKSINC